MVMAMAVRATISVDVMIIVTLIGDRVAARGDAKAADESADRTADRRAGDAARYEAVLFQRAPPELKRRRLTRPLTGQE
jgi:hypothetical protein